MLTLSALTGPSGMGGGSKSAYPAERPEEHIGRSSPLKGFHWTVKDSFKLPISFKSIASSCFSDTKRSFVSHFLEFWLFQDFEVQWSWKGHWKVMERSFKSQNQTFSWANPTTTALPIFLPSETRMAMASPMSGLNVVVVSDHICS